MLDKFFKIIEKITPQKWRWILNHEGFKRYFANTGWMFGGQMFSLLVSFFIGAWIARYLGPENYGVLSYAVAFVGLFWFIADFGSGSILNRELIEFPEKRDKLMGTVFRLKLIGGVVAFLLTVASTYLFQINSAIRLLIILFSLSLILQAINVISIYFQSEVKSKNNVKALFFSTIISSCLKVLVILFDKGITWIVIVFVLDFLWQGLGFMSAYKKQGLKMKNWSYDKKLSRTILKKSLFLMIAAAAGFIYIKIDQVMIGYMLGSYEVGIYAAAVKLVEIWYFIPGIICASLFPAIVNAKKTNPDVYKRRLKALYLLMFLTALVISIFSTILAPWIIFILFGSKYAAAVVILQIYVWSGIGLFIGTAINRYFLSENRNNYILWYSVCSMILNVVFNIIFIPTIGLNGAAWATLLSYSAGPLVVFLVSKFNYFKK